MKNLEQIQEENRKSIILANNPEAKDYEEALEMEIGYNCKIYDLKHQFFGHNDPTEMIMVYGDYKDDDEGCFLHYRGNPIIKVNFEALPDKDNYKIIGKPLTLDRVLVSINHLIAKIEPHRLSQPYLIFYRLPDYNEVFTWDLTKPTLTLEEQTEETQKAVAKLLGFGEGEND
jgi:hypothetical protein